MDTDDLWDRLDIPESVSRRIDGDEFDDGDEEQQREQYVHYYITCSPHALMGWSHIAERLHGYGEETAKRAAKDYVQRAPGTCGCGMQGTVSFRIFIRGGDKRDNHRVRGGKDCTSVFISQE